MNNQRANRYISMNYRYGQRILTRLLRKHGLPIEAGQLPFLRQVQRQPGITQEQLSSTIGMDKGTTARMVSQLEANGLVTRQSDEKDRRINHIYATAAADELHPKIVSVVEEFHIILYQGLSESEIEAATDLLIRMKDNLLEYLKDHPCKKN
ncbi:MAG: MarR family transcriptional regulator [Clostridiales bacterium]|nr:MarR family transcriptional regulator [Clostridiales bacterium]